MMLHQFYLFYLVQTDVKVINKSGHHKLKSGILALNRGKKGLGSRFEFKTKLGFVYH